jgi:hypothetical protein
MMASALGLARTTQPGCARRRLLPPLARHRARRDRGISGEALMVCLELGNTFSGAAVYRDDAIASGRAGADGTVHNRERHGVRLTSARMP